VHWTWPGHGPLGPIHDRSAPGMIRKECKRLAEAVAQRGLWPQPKPNATIRSVAYRQVNHRHLCGSEPIHRKNVVKKIRKTRNYGIAMQRARAFCVPLRLFLAIPLYPSPFIGGQQHANHRQPARRGDGALNAARVIMHARSRGTTPPAGLPTLPSRDSNEYTPPLRCAPPRCARCAERVAQRYALFAFLCGFSWLPQPPRFASGAANPPRWQTRLRGRPRPIFRPLSRTGENPPYGISGETMETSASFEARSAPWSYPTANQRTQGSVRGVSGNRYPYRDRLQIGVACQCMRRCKNAGISREPWVTAIISRGVRSAR
jgi:hypothetical protein